MSDIEMKIEVENEAEDLSEELFDEALDEDGGRFCYQPCLCGCARCS